MENMTHPDILEAERYGLPEDKPEPCYCSICSFEMEQEVHCEDKQCGALVCDECRFEICDKVFCSKECADAALREEHNRVCDRNRHLTFLSKVHVGHIIEMGEAAAQIWKLTCVENGGYETNRMQIAGLLGKITGIAISYKERHNDNV